MRRVRGVRAMREVASGQVGSTLVDGRGESHDLLRLIFSVLRDGHCTGAGGDDGGSDDGEARDFHSSDVSAILRDF